MLIVAINHILVVFIHFEILSAIIDLGSKTTISDLQWTLDVSDPEIQGVPRNLFDSDMKNKSMAIFQEHNQNTFYLKRSLTLSLSKYSYLFQLIHRVYTDMQVCVFPSHYCLADMLT